MTKTITSSEHEAPTNLDAEDSEEFRYAVWERLGQIETRLKAASELLDLVKWDIDHGLDTDPGEMARNLVLSALEAIEHFSDEMPHEVLNATAMTGAEQVETKKRNDKHTERIQAAVAAAGRKLEGVQEKPRSGGAA